MKKLCAAVLCFAIISVLAAVWYSPLCALGSVDEYRNNERVCAVEGVCYNTDNSLRVELEGGEKELTSALDKICAEVVCAVKTGNRTVVYAYSPRVAAKPLTAINGNAYNVMAAYGGGKVVIGTTVIEGSY